MYGVNFYRDAIKVLRRMPGNVARLILSRVEHLAQDPMAKNNNVKALEGREGYRLRVGDYRVLYDLDHDRRILTVTEVGHRKDIYR
ncbi:MAG TPA: type II toxin-antitoxin system RelE/ParE family toxin [Stellaceae bacterium]|nr:type II toxin-antitoxin system RelE/ParE family toxin [Stellaceae bacterium]